MTERAAHNHHWQTADIVFGCSLAMSFLLNWLWPMSFEALNGSILRHLIGAPLLFLGTLIIVLSKRELARFKQPSEPKNPTTMIVKSGCYGYSRNPLYTGLVFCFCGLSFAINMPWGLILLVPTIFITNFFLIHPEEEYLEKRFKQEFTNYKEKVRRWL